MSGKAKNPRHPPAPLTITPTDVLAYSGPLWRIHRPHERHPSAWNTFREFGPLDGMRWDPHPLPVSIHPGVGVLYAATDTLTAFAEVFQKERRIDLNPSQLLSSWRPTTALRLLDLTPKDPKSGLASCALRSGASASLHAGEKSTCRNWAAAIHAQVDVDGLYVPSTLTGAPMVVLFSSSRASFPARPGFSRPLTHPVSMAAAITASDALHWPLIGGWPRS